MDDLTRQFYAWERRCRGWDAYSYAVDLEPTFVPFFYHDVPYTSSQLIDDGKRHTLASWIISGFKSAPKIEQPESNNQELDLTPYPFEDDSQLEALRVSLPNNQKVRMEEMHQLLLMLSQSRFPISFEIIAISKAIRIQFVCRQYDASHVCTQIKAYFPECGIQEATLDDIIPQGKEGVIVDLGLQEEFMRPLSMPKNYDLDPLTGLFGILENLRNDEQVNIQILFKGAINPWAESIIRAVSDYDGSSFFIDAPEMAKLAQEKISAPLFAVTIRITTFDKSGEIDLADRVSTAIRQTTSSPYNALIRLNGDGYEPDSYMDDMAFRQTHRLGMLLNSKELATLVHFPSPSIISHKLERDTKRTKVAPEIFYGHEHVLGTNIHQGIEREVTVSAQQRLKHTHIIGATGTGKSMLLFTSITQDILNGEGVAVLDPHGDLIDLVLSWMHPDRRKDVILIDPADSEFPVGFNILTAHSEIEKDILSSDLVAAFKRLSTSWGDQMNSVFANAILAFLESNKGGTVIDLRRFLIEKSYREAFLKTVADPSIVYYWQKEYPILKSSSVGSILTRLDSFLRPKLIRNMVAQNKSLDFEEILDSKKILLIKLSQGLIGNENSYLLGTFMVSKIQQAAMARQAKAKSDRSNFYLYIDEFQNFITPSMSAILSGARKYHLGLILAHQDMQQLTKNDSELASSIVANAGTRICFRLGDTDSKKFESNFSYFDAADLQNLDTGEAIIRIERPDNDCNLSTLPLTELEEDIAMRNKGMVIASSREVYGTPKDQVEALLKDSHEVIQNEPVEKRENAPLVFEPASHPKQPEPIELKEIHVPKINPEEKKQETQHRYLQTLIKRMAESRGYKAILEEPTSNGGRVDVGLLKNESKIAVEISVTTPGSWEIQNIRKCLASGYMPVIVCSADSKHLGSVKKIVLEQIEPESSVLFLEPEALFLYLDQQTAKELNKEERVKGYRVKVEYSALPDEVSKAKRDTVLKNVSESLRKSKK